MPAPRGAVRHTGNGKEDVTQEVFPATKGRETRRAQAREHRTRCRFQPKWTSTRGTLPLETAVVRLAFPSTSCRQETRGKQEDTDRSDWARERDADGPPRGEQRSRRTDHGRQSKTPRGTRRCRLPSPGDAQGHVHHSHPAASRRHGARAELPGERTHPGLESFQKTPPA